MADLSGSAIDIATAGLAGVGAIDHDTAFNFGIRGDGELGGLCFRYWEPKSQAFSRRFVRLKPDCASQGRKYLQPVGEPCRLYHIPGTTLADLENSFLPVFLVEGEKKALSLDKALRQLQIPGLVIGLGGVWAWRHSPKELKPDGSLGKGKSQPIEELDGIRWTARTVYLVFDSDVSTNWRVKQAETALAKDLARRGARVRILRIRGGES